MAGFTSAFERPDRRRRVLAVVAALVGVALVGGGGGLLPVERASVPSSRIPLVGRVTTVCAAASADAAQAGQTTVSAVVVRQAPGREGKLTGTPLAATDPAFTLTEQGKGTQLPDATTPVLLAGEGVMATAGSGAVLTRATEGSDAGLAAAPCLAPATSLWFAGLGASDSDRTELVLTNPDDAQAEVDLRFYGRLGRVIVPGSPGLVIDARSSRTVSLTSVVKADGPLGLVVQASKGRVAAAARRTLSDDLTPAGTDWQVPSFAPSAELVIPAVPEGDGGRQLVVTNPGLDRASIAIQVLGLQGAYAPSGAETIEVAAESSASVDLAPGLAGEAGTIRLSSDRPVTAAVISSSSRAGACERPRRAERQRSAGADGCDGPGHRRRCRQRTDREQRRRAMTPDSASRW